MRFPVVTYYEIYAYALPKPWETMARGWHDKYVTRMMHRWCTVKSTAKGDTLLCGSHLAGTVAANVSWCYVTAQVCRKVPAPTTSFAAKPRNNCTLARRRILRMFNAHVFSSTVDRTEHGSSFMVDLDLRMSSIQLLILKCNLELPVYQLSPDLIYTFSAPSKQIQWAQVTQTVLQMSSSIKSTLEVARSDSRTWRKALLALQH